ncbi:transposase, partial [Pseudomonas aeruginosa]|uniref:transposase n=1 Tax=Pseudomonas aeruginosa TaxID=287 RepID=UPI003896B585
MSNPPWVKFQSAGWVNFPSAPTLCRRHGFSDASFYTWRAKFGGMTVADAKRLKDLELENSRLKK